MDMEDYLRRKELYQRKTEATVKERMDIAKEAKDVHIDQIKENLTMEEILLKTTLLLVRKENAQTQLELYQTRERADSTLLKLLKSNFQEALRSSMESLEEIKNQSF